MRVTSFIAAAIALFIALASPAAAQPPYDVTVGGGTGTFAVEASSVGPVAFGGVSCDDVTLAGSLNAVTGSNGQSVAEITGSTWIDCLLLGMIDAQVQQVGTWSVNFTGDASAPTLAGQITDIEAVVTDLLTGGLICSYTVSGVAEVFFDEAAQQLVVDETGLTGNLTVSNVSGCLGQVLNGDSANFLGTFDLQAFDASNNPVGPITITP